MEDETAQADEPTHTPGTRKGEQMPQDDGQESGRQESGTTDTGRPTGTSTARFSTGINPEDENPIDPNSPELPPP